MGRAQTAESAPMEPPVHVTTRSVKASGATPVRLERPALIHALSGVMRLEADGLRWTLPPGRAVLVGADQTVSVSVPLRLTAVWLHFDHGLIAEPLDGLSVFEMTDLALALLGALRAGEPPLEPAAARRMVQTLGDVVRCLAMRPLGCVLPAPTSPGLIKAVALAEAQLETLPAFAEIARESGQSTRSLTRRCAEELGMSWRDLIRRLRMLRAVEALATTEAPVAEIAVLVGYSALSGFNEAFRDLMGQSPTEFRASCRALG